ncbi:hypothetical protein Lal_00012786 [Lupinus albus]|nr:hypothetical protein Lal_00012786 [Lupinus albus]
MASYEALQRSQRNLMGEDLSPLSSKELESLERQLDSSLKQIRSTRVLKFPIPMGPNMYDAVVAVKATAILQTHQCSP